MATHKYKLYYFQSKTTRKISDVLMDNKNNPRISSKQNKKHGMGMMISENGTFSFDHEMKH
ncbi:hypothetical protein BLA29_006420 [Euroglyphus maynei]|uniref:Uncharacterized protein n=1 Tax=Euroglyphus maynei TaxID=6958 RepID=A0A1Y3B5U6_EURMA|nr:hypothetical protein BLA29_006420 [Euroglyphus maynei]